MTARKPLANVAGLVRPLRSTETLQTLAATTANASLNAPHGTAPTSPVDGDVWTTSAGLFIRINGVTVGPLVAGSLLNDIAGLTLAQGDVLYYDGSHIVNLGHGTTGQVLQTGGASANPSWSSVAASAAPAWPTTVTTAGQTSITLTPPISGFTHLGIILAGRSAAATTDDNVLISFNSDTTIANYNSQQMQGNTGSATANAFTSASGTPLLSRLVGDFPGSTATANRAGSVEILVPDYLGTTFHKEWHSTSGQAAFPIVKVVSGNWASASAITTVTITLISGGAFVANTKATLIYY